MKRISLLAIAAFAAAIAVSAPASARLGIAPGATTAAQDDAVIQVRGGHGRGHMGRGGRGHHYGWSRGRGHHYGWARGGHRHGRHH